MPSPDLLPLHRLGRIALGIVMSITMLACSDDPPIDPDSGGTDLNTDVGDPDTDTSAPGNEPEDDGGGLNANPDTGGASDSDEDESGGPSPGGGTTGP